MKAWREDSKSASACATSCTVPDIVTLGTRRASFCCSSLAWIRALNGDPGWRPRLWRASCEAWMRAERYSAAAANGSSPTWLAVKQHTERQHPAISQQLSDQTQLFLFHSAPHPGCILPNPRSPIRAGYSMLDAGCRMPDATKWEIHLLVIDPLFVELDYLPAGHAD